ncbi:VOC family protein [Pseudoxanthomonas winnipegensis]|uniref:VOC family protein n=1 Tax=Pseudoxanthomonas winnipegensis TaxID=2480810 RepID=A0A4Q9TFZ8_9GAMM|nr:VOC family protein [Pseudoxanthomonas winnipegensis]RZZ81615.1 VOC family protein [Pseudoxanthomonas winnipegensis]TAA24728.1 VOC family protein [Pseudoxanthomonas winnipegensis]TAA39980.1 VOC family protein [Pseudoxanthomonas winnipegensis]TBV74608.1 VOC family protein [Pseudoxanthomonas winnipegensis]TBV75452.1 VOC family protein [Pseudoxanthomonas winnipegensis]
MAIQELYAYLCVRDAVAAMDFYARAFGARELFRLTEPDGRIGHAEVDLDGHTLMLSEEYPDMGVRSPEHLGATPVTLHLHVDDADALVARAVAAGGTLERAMQDHFYGERSGTVRDPFGHRWLIGHATESVTPEEMQRRYTALFAAER